MILSRAFSSSSVLELSFEIGSQISSIAPDAFSNSLLESIILPDNLLSIPSGFGKDAINLHEISFLGEIRHIPPEAFSNCLDLQSVKIHQETLLLYGNLYFSDGLLLSFSSTSFVGVLVRSIVIGSQSDILFTIHFKNFPELKIVEIEDPLPSIPDNMFDKCKSLTSISIGGIPIFENGILNLSKDSSSLRISSLKSSSSSGISRVGDDAFSSNPNIRIVDLPGDIELGARSFANLTNLETVSFSSPISNSSFGVGVFEGATSLRRVTFSQPDLPNFDPSTLFEGTPLEGLSWTDILSEKEAPGDVTIGTSIAMVVVYVIIGIVVVLIIVAVIFILFLKSGKLTYNRVLEEELNPDHPEINELY